MGNPAVDFPWEFLNVADDQLVHTGRCVLHNIVINSGGGATVTVYDGVAAAGTVIAIIALTNALPVTLHFDVACATGIYCDFSAKAGNITVTWE